MVGIYLNQIFKQNKILVKGKLSRYRDFIYIDNILSIIIKCMKIKDNKSHLYNVCTSNKTSVKDLINKIFFLLKTKNKILSKGNMPGDQFSIYGNKLKIKKKLKIKSFIKLDDGLKTIVSIDS